MKEKTAGENPFSHAHGLVYLQVYNTNNGMQCCLKKRMKID